MEWVQNLEHILWGRSWCLSVTIWWISISKITTLVSGMDLPEWLLSSKGCGMGSTYSLGAKYGIPATIRWISMLKITTNMNEVDLLKFRLHQMPGQLNFKAQWCSSYDLLRDEIAIRAVRCERLTSPLALPSRRRPHELHG